MSLSKHSTWQLYQAVNVNISHRQANRIRQVVSTAEAQGSYKADLAVFGKVEPGWYVAMNGWHDSYANDLRALGYRVEMSVTKPEVA